MIDNLFVDTNVLVYRHDATEPEKQEQSARWLEWLWRTQRGRISSQVLQEFYSTVTRKLRPGLDAETARTILRPYFAWAPVLPTTHLMERAWQLESRYRLSWWDTLIVAAALQARCRWLLSEDLSAQQDLDGLTVVNPFTTSPETLAGG